MAAQTLSGPTSRKAVTPADSSVRTASRKRTGRLICSTQYSGDDHCPGATACPLTVETAAMSGSR